jgi:threonine/homoserine/homoserine lactone efflux protein
MDTFWAFIGISIVVIVTPGPDTAVTIRSALMGGARGGVFTALGVCTGQTIWVLATSAGIVALLVASEQIFFAVKMIGAAYLVYLGIHSIVSAFRAGGWKAVGAASEPRRRLPPGKAFRQGLLSDLSNPKIAAFFTSLLPQFVPAGEASFWAFAWLGLVFCLLTLTWLAAYSWVVARAGDFLRRPRIRRTLEAVMGTILIALGLRLATEQR